MPIIGAHVTGGIKGGVAKALEIRAQALQIFVGSPQTWRPANPAPADVENFRSGVVEHKLGPVFVHSIYLVNLASQKSDFYEKSVAALANQLGWADAVGAHGLIFHPGSAGADSLELAKRRVVEGIRRVLEGYSGEAKLLLETCAGQGATIGRRFEDLADIIAALDHDPRVGVCIDTCHVFNAGYDITSDGGLAAMLAEVEHTVGLERVHAVHANDSRTGLGAQVDRHENIGRGKIGETAFARLLRHSAFERQPFILEVPGYEDKGPDLQNVLTLRRLAGMEAS